MKTETVNTRQEWQKPVSYKVLTGQIAPVPNRQMIGLEPYSQVPDPNSEFVLHGIKMHQLDQIINQRATLLGSLDFQTFYIHRRYIQTNDRYVKLYHCQISAKNVTPKATVCLVHGFSEHMEYHFETAIQFALNGYDCQLIDLRGHGYSTGPRCLNTIVNYHQDIQALIEQVRKDKPCFFYAHSMGCLATVSFLQKNSHLNIAGVILNGPFLDLHPIMQAQLPPHKRRILKMMVPNANEFLINGGLNPGVVSKNPQMTLKILRDSRMVPIINPSQVVSWLNTIASIKRGYELFTFPLLVLHGTDDQLCDIKASIKFVRRVASADKLIIPIDGAYHHLQYEPEAADILVIESLKFMARKLQERPANLGDPSPIYLGLLKPRAPSTLARILVFSGLGLVALIILFLIYAKVKYGIGPGLVWMFFKFWLKKKLFKRNH